MLRSEARYFELAHLEAAIDRKLDVLHFKGKVISIIANYFAISSDWILYFILGLFLVGVDQTNFDIFFWKTKDFLIWHLMFAF